MCGTFTAAKAVGEPPLMLAIAVWAAARIALAYIEASLMAETPGHWRGMLRCLSQAK